MPTHLYHGLAIEDRRGHWGKRTLCGQRTQALPADEGYYATDPRRAPYRDLISCPRCRARLAAAPPPPGASPSF